jgi:hypothetical protein
MRPLSRLAAHGAPEAIFRGALYLIAQFGPLFPISLAKNGYGACCRSYFQRRESGSDLVNANFVKSVSGKNPRFALELALAFNRDQ